MHRGRRNGHRTLSRLVTLLTLALLTGGALIPKITGAESPYSTISPASKQANDIQDLYKILFWLALLVFVGVQIGIVYTVLRYRRKSNLDERPEQIHGNKTVEVVWTIIPAVVLLAIFIPTVSTIYGQSDDTKSGDYTVEVYGKQWWWEVHYTEPDDVAGVITGNEIHLPQGKRVIFKLYSNNVIHSFWVPQLSGKMDVIPGHENKLSIDTDKTGYDYGECAEFCGDSHALMRFKVIVEPQEQFDDWIAAWKAGPTEASSQFAAPGDVTKVPPAFGLCLACHRIEGTNANVAPVGIEEAANTEEGGPGAARTAGPNLTLLGCRTTLAAGTLRNTPENLAKWLHDPGSIKPGNYMATVVQPGTLKDNEIQQLVDYLESLQPEGGCGPIPEQPGVDEQVQVTDPD